MADQELLWKQYSLHVDLYKFYIEATIKLNVFHCAITGAILSVFLAKIKEIPMIKWALILPITLGLALAILYRYGAKLLEAMRTDVFNIRDALGLETAPEMKVLGLMLWIFAGAQILTAIGMAVAMCVF